jgi:hypothetical protein
MQPDSYAGAGPYEYSYGEPAGYEDDWWRDEPGRMLNPVRILLVILVIGSGAVALYGMFLDRTRLQMPLTVSGFAVLAMSLGFLSLSAARGAAGLGRRGYGGRALGAALFGGLCAMGAAGSLAAAIILGLLAASA